MNYAFEVKPGDLLVRRSRYVHSAFRVGESYKVTEVLHDSFKIEGNDGHILHTNKKFLGRKWKKGPQNNEESLSLLHT